MVVSRFLLLTFYSFKVENKFSFFVVEIRTRVNKATDLAKLRMHVFFFGAMSSSFAIANFAHICCNVATAGHNSPLNFLKPLA